MSEGYTPTEATAASGNTRHAEQAKLETSYKGGGQPLSFLRKHINSSLNIQMNHNSDGQQAICEHMKNFRSTKILQNFAKDNNLQYYEVSYNGEDIRNCVGLNFANYPVSGQGEIAEGVVSTQSTHSEAFDPISQNIITSSYDGYPQNPTVYNFHQYLGDIMGEEFDTHRPTCRAILSESFAWFDAFPFGFPNTKEKFTDEDLANFNSLRENKKLIMAVSQHIYDILTVFTNITCFNAIGEAYHFLKQSCYINFDEYIIQKCPFAHASLITSHKLSPCQSLCLYAGTRDILYHLAGTCAPVISIKEMMDRMLAVFNPTNTSLNDSYFYYGYLGNERDEQKLVMICRTFKEIAEIFEDSNASDDGFPCLEDYKIVQEEGDNYYSVFHHTASGLMFEKVHFIMHDYNKSFGLQVENNEAIVDAWKEQALELRRSITQQRFDDALMVWIL